MPVSVTASKSRKAWLYVFLHCPGKEKINGFLAQRFLLHLTEKRVNFSLQSASHSWFKNAHDSRNRLIKCYYLNIGEKREKEEKILEIRQ